MVCPTILKERTNVVLSSPVLGIKEVSLMKENESERVQVREY